MIDNENVCRCCKREFQDCFDVRWKFCDDCINKGAERLKVFLEELCDEYEITDEDDREAFIYQIIEKGA